MRQFSRIGKYRMEQMVEKSILLSKLVCTGLLLYPLILEQAVSRTELATEVAGAPPPYLVLDDFCWLIEEDVRLDPETLISVGEFLKSHAIE